MLIKFPHTQFLHVPGKYGVEPKGHQDRKCKVMSKIQAFRVLRNQDNHEYYYLHISKQEDKSTKKWIISDKLFTGHTL